MSTTQAYALLAEACRLLDESSDHAIAAYACLGMALLEEKYGLDVELPDGDMSSMPPPAVVQAEGACLAARA